MSSSDSGNIYSGSESNGDNGDVYGAPVTKAVQRTLSTNEFYGRKRLRPRQVKKSTYQAGGSSVSSEKDDSDTDRHYIPHKDVSPKKAITPKKHPRGRVSAKRPGAQRVPSPDMFAESPLKQDTSRGSTKRGRSGRTRGPSKQPRGSNRPGTSGTRARRLLQRPPGSSGNNMVILNIILSLVIM